MKRIAYLLIISLFIAACTKDLDVPFPKHESRLTLNSFLVEGNQPFLYLTRSFGALETVNDSIILVKDADVELWKEGIFFSKLIYKDTVVQDTFWKWPEGFGRDEFAISPRRVRAYLPKVPVDTLKAFETYEFRASHADYGEASASAKVVPKPEILSIEIVEDSLIYRDFLDGYQEKWSAVKVRVNDPPQVQNAYYFNPGTIAFEEIYNTQNIVDTLYSTSYWATEILQDIDGYSYGENKMIPDYAIDGQEGEITVFVQLPGCCGYPGDDFDEEIEYRLLSLELQLIMVDQEYADFWEKQFLQVDNRSTGLESVFVPSEPVGVPNNVQGGYGLIGSYGVTIKTFDLE